MGAATAGMTGDCAGGAADGPIAFIAPWDNDCAPAPAG